MRSESFCGMSGTVRRGSTSTAIYARLCRAKTQSGQRGLKSAVLCRFVSGGYKL